ncbi:carbohydrate ABC transporter membrane protein 2 (CUT1 family) [Hungatella effluvii]|uniref:Carbohydrate ABC transporter membrane protein 2 (CUT1 family) n=1 Tax=Hungatella effluvii TaxID=1096246 RepID=A0A2V3Y286_9FIRM|nr:carbohydrate ABC transporter permease [Hungatella effluvii]PXX52005.1 carbohydrate ABC transporter membrane protein 2 (CUT1 family) [Hungatella effluvii]
MRVKRIKAGFSECMMILISVVFVVPIYYLVVSTFKTQQEIFEQPLALPVNFTIENYEKAFSKMNFGVSFSNSLFITLISIIFIVLFGSMAAYALARRKQNSFIRFLDNYFLLGFMIPLQTTMIPLFAIMNRLHLINSLWGLIFLHSNGCIFGSFLYKGFIRALPVDLEEAARIDGASMSRTFWQIVFPLLKPVTATLIIFNVMWIWNDFMLTYLFISSTKKTTLIMQVYNGIGMYSKDWSIMMPVLVIALLPMVIFYILMQKQIIGGLTAGSLKG